MPTPVTVFTGYLGSGKTTIILGLIKQLPRDYRSVWLKNEFGNIDVDSQLAKENNIEVKEILNGCLCCVLVGRLGDALEEIAAKYHPDRIIVETSGSAYPAPIAVEIRRHPQTLKLDGIITVIDALNFTGYKDKSFTAKIQAQYTDLILINKHEGINERQLEDVLDDVFELNLTTPKVRTDHGSVSPELVFGLDTRLFETAEQVAEEEKGKEPEHHRLEVEIMEAHSNKVLDRAVLEQLLKELPPEYFYRIKGMVAFADGHYLLNYVFGRFDLQKMAKYTNSTRLVFMGKELRDHADKVRAALGLDAQELQIK